VPHPPLTRNFRLHEVAELANVPVITLRGWIRRRLVPAPHKLGRLLFFTEAQVRQILKQQPEGAGDASQATD
jgi:hypothetical protein